MKKKWFKRAVLAAVVLAVGVAAVCVALSHRSLGFANLGDISSQEELVMGASRGGIYYMNVNDTGIFYLDGDFMKYCDYDSGKSYVVCDKANCLHVTSECGAYLKDAAAFAAYGGYLYAFVVNETENTYELLRMDMNGQNRRVVTSFDLGSYGENEWYLASTFVGNVYYGYGRAYVPLEYKQMPGADGRSSNRPSRLQLVVVDLDTGAQKLLFEDEFLASEHSLEWSAISEDLVAITFIRNKDRLYGDALQQAVDAGELDYLYEMMDGLPSEWASLWNENDLALFYHHYASFFVTENKLSIYVYDFSSDTLTEVIQEPLSILFAENEFPAGWFQPVFICGLYEDSLLLCRHERDETGTTFNTTLLRADRDGTLEELLQIDSGGPVSFYFGTASASHQVLSDGTMIYTHRDENVDGVEIRCFDLTTGSDRLLYVDSCPNITFRFLGETEDAYIGEMVTVDSSGTVSSQGAFLIAKTDYLAGNLDAARELKVS